MHVSKLVKKEISVGTRNSSGNKQVLGDNLQSKILGGNTGILSTHIRSNIPVAVTLSVSTIIVLGMQTLVQVH